MNEKRLTIGPITAAHGPSGDDVRKALAKSSEMLRVVERLRKWRLP